MCTYFKTTQWSRARGLAEVLGGSEILALLERQGSLWEILNFSLKSPDSGETEEWHRGLVFLGDNLAVLCERHGCSKASSETAILTQGG